MHVPVRFHCLRPVLCVCVFFFVFALDIPLPSRGRREGLYVQWKMFGTVYFILFHEYVCMRVMYYRGMLYKCLNTRFIISVFG